MMPTDHEIPFANDSERAHAFAGLLDMCKQLETWIMYAADPREMRPDDRIALAANLQSGDAPERKLRRWASLFAEEIQSVLDARNRVVHAVRLTDTELRNASWLARRLLNHIQGNGAA